MLDSIYYEISELIYCNVCMKKIELFDFKREEKGKDPHTCSMFWPGLAHLLCSLVPGCHCQCYDIPHGVRLLHAPPNWGSMVLHLPAPSPSPSRAPTGLAAVRAGTAQDCSLVYQFYGVQAVIWHCFICLWLLPSFQVCYLIMGLRNQCVCTSACIWSHRGISSGQHRPHGRAVGAADLLHLKSKR